MPTEDWEKANGRSWPHEGHAPAWPADYPPGCICNPPAHTPEQIEADESFHSRSCPEHPGRRSTGRADKILVEEVTLHIHGTAAVYRMSPTGRGLSGGGLATLHEVRQDDGTRRVTISRLDIYGIDLHVSPEAWSRCLDVSGVESLDTGTVFFHVDGKATEWENRPDGRQLIAQDHGSLSIVDMGHVLRATLALRLGTALEMAIPKEEWSRAFAESSGRLMAASVPLWPLDEDFADAAAIIKDRSASDP